MEREGSEDAAHDFDHLIRVMALADTIAAREGGDLPTIWAAVALHDIGQARELRQGGDHALIGAEMALELLRTPASRRHPSRLCSRPFANTA